jgi:long-subunit fatty acid transport protein
MASDEAGRMEFVLGVSPLSGDPVSAPALGTSPYGLGFAGSANSWRSGLDQWEGRSTQDQPVGGVFVAPGISYRASSNLAVGAGVGLRYYLAPAGSSELPAALRYPASGGSGLRGADLNLGLRYALDPGTEVGLAYRSRFKEDAWSQRYPTTRYSDFTTPGVQVPGVTVPQALSATMSHQFGERWALTGALGWQEMAQAEGSAFSQGATLRGGEAWFAGVGARYALRENLGVGMSVEYLYGSGLDPVRRNLVPAASPGGDGSYYFFGLDLNWRF